MWHHSTMHGGVVYLFESNKIKEKYMYKEEFDLSIDRTNRFSLGNVICKHQENMLLSDDDGRLLSDVFFNTFGWFDPNDLMAKCFSIHYKILKPIELALNVKPIYTIGYLESNGKYIYKKSEDELLAIMKQDYKYGGELNMHAWITLPSMEIIDYTLATTIAFVKNMDSSIGQIYCGYADGINEKLKYHPMLVGEGCFRSMGLMMP